ncbi:MAG: Polyphosphate:AMP/ADP phosphotransferase [Gemmatimonadaceae bacterium]|nr:Polyphosphate:AMP/ADP phosphotransferase [Gemmatimonadaceae bacterium]
MLVPVDPRKPLSLTDADARPPRFTPKGDELHERLDRAVSELGDLQEVIYADRRFAILVILQGRDASGKDGTIKHVFNACNPQGCRVKSFKAPTAEELSHDYLWRVHHAIPERGMIGIFNRSHYEDVIVTRVKGLVPRKIWEARYEQINAFERHLTENSVVILKFFLHVSRDEQAEQLRERLTDPTKNWKFRAGDLEDRKLWKDYTVAYRDALRKCSTRWAPWYVVPADHNPTRNLLVTETINARLRKLKLHYPRAAQEVLDLVHTIR